jgi:hypothetical protein
VAGIKWVFLMELSSLRFGFFLPVGEIVAVADTAYSALTVAADRIAQSNRRDGFAQIHWLFNYYCINERRLAVFSPRV